MNTALMMKRPALRQVAATVALVMFIASVPAVGVAVVADRGGPAFTVDICHPLQALDRAGDAIAIARPAPPAPLRYPGLSDRYVELVPIRAAGFILIPDPPPPESIV